MHLDGGGSSTLVADTNDTAGLVLKNRPSDASMRKIVNGLGVFNNAPVGPAAMVSLHTSADKVFFGEPVAVTLTGLDQNSKKTALPPESVACYTDDPIGRWEGNLYYPGRTGTINIFGEYNGFLAHTSIANMPLAQIIPSMDSLKMVQGESVSLTFEGVSASGDTSALKGVSFEVVPSQLGTITPEGVFTANSGETGYIRCYSGDVSAYIGVTIGAKLNLVTNFNNAGHAMEFSGSNENIKGSVGFSDTVNNPGNYAVALSYQFE
jgi:hypothetical protein